MAPARRGQSRRRSEILDLRHRCRRKKLAFGPLRPRGGRRQSDGSYPRTPFYPPGLYPNFYLEVNRRRTSYSTLTRQHLRPGTSSSRVTPEHLRPWTSYPPAPLEGFAGYVGNIGCPGSILSSNPYSHQQSRRPIIPPTVKNSPAEFITRTVGEFPAWLCAGRSGHHPSRGGAVAWQGGVGEAPGILVWVC